MLADLKVLEKPAREPLAFEDVADYLHSTSGQENFVRFVMLTSRQLLESRLGVAFFRQKLQATFEFRHLPTDLAVTLPANWTWRPLLCQLPRPPLSSIELMEIENQPGSWEPLVNADPNVPMYWLWDQFPAIVGVNYTAFNIWQPGITQRYMSALPRIRATFYCGWDDVDDIPEKYLLLLQQTIAWNYLQSETGGLPPELKLSILAERVFDL